MDEAWISREIYVAAIKGCTRERGAKAALARRAGITPQYLSYLLALDTDLSLGAEKRRQASVGTARRVAAALPLPFESREQLLEHMITARERRQQVKRNVTQNIIDVPRLSSEVRSLAHRATHAPDPLQARRLYSAVVESGQLLAEQMVIRDWPIEYVELCLCMHDALCVLDNPLSALQFARYGQLVLDWAPRMSYRGNEERVQALETNLIRAIGVAYNNLHLPKEADPYLEQARHTTGFTRRPQDWLVHLSRDKLSTLSKLPRFRISEVERVAGEALDRIGESQDIFRDLYALLLKAKLSDCYVVFGGARKNVEPLLADLAEQAERATGLGVLHRVIIYRTYALLCRQSNDSVGLAQWRQRALDMAEEAGLAHQARTIRRVLF